jgi:hypothetical protein
MHINLGDIQMFDRILMQQHVLMQNGNLTDEHKFWLFKTKTKNSFVFSKSFQRI